MSIKHGNINEPETPYGVDYQDRFDRIIRMMKVGLMLKNAKISYPENPSD